jgi:hypothetical protein
MQKLDLYHYFLTAYFVSLCLLKLRKIKVNTFLEKYFQPRSVSPPTEIESQFERHAIELSLSKRG